MKNSKILAIKPTSNPSKIQLEIEDNYEKPGTTTNVLAALNKSDDRFKSNNRVLIWITAEAIDAIDMFPQVAKEIQEVVNSGNEHRFNVPIDGFITMDNEQHVTRIRIVETSKLKPNDLPYLSTKAKKIPGKDGNPDRFLLTNNMLVFRYNQLVVSNDGVVDHQFLDYEDTSTELNNCHFIMNDMIVIGTAAEIVSNLAGEKVS